MLWVFYVINLYTSSGNKGPIWFALYTAFGVAACIIPVISLFLLITRWRVLMPKKRIHLLVAVLFY